MNVKKGDLAYSVPTARFPEAPGGVVCEVLRLGPNVPTVGQTWWVRFVEPQLCRTVNSEGVTSATETEEIEACVPDEVLRPIGGPPRELPADPVKRPVEETT